VFIFPIVIYLFFASGKNNFAKLPVLTTGVMDLSSFTHLRDDKVILNDHITVLCYWGSDLNLKKGDAFNLNQKIYKRFYQFKDFQFVALITNDQENQVVLLEEDLSKGAGTDLVNWKFMKGSSIDIENHFTSLKTTLELDAKHSTPYVFIIDRNGNLRGRDDDEDIGTLFGYNAESASPILFSKSWMVNYKGKQL
jgi:hypothetical protein